MTSSVADVPETVNSVETRKPCPVCMTTLSLDDEQSRMGTVRWEISPHARLKVGTAVAFECPNGHSSQQEPNLLKAFPSRRL